MPQTPTLNHWVCYPVWVCPGNSGWAGPKERERMKNLLMIAVLSIACGGPEPDTWGNASEDIVVAYCDALGACYEWDEGAVTTCIKHTAFHLCEIDDTCDVEISEERRTDVDACVLDMPDQNCFLLAWGALPVSCDPALEQE